VREHGSAAGRQKPISNTDAPVNSSTAPTDTTLDADASHANLVEAVTTLAEDVADLRRENEQLRDEVSDLREQVEEHDTQLDDQDARLDALSTGLSTAHDEIEAVEEQVDAAEPTPSDGDTAVQRDELTPIERLSTDGDVEDVTSSASVERAVEIFENIQSWGTKVPRGYTIRPEDNPLALLEAARDESLSWRQWYRAAETVEQLSRGAITFFDSDRHGKTLILHEQSAVYDRVTSGSLTPSSVEATT
jgi:phage shock protein A